MQRDFDAGVGRFDGGRELFRFQRGLEFLRFFRVRTVELRDQAFERFFTVRDDFRPTVERGNFAKFADEAVAL